MIVIETLIGSILLLGIAFCWMKAMAALDSDYSKVSDEPCNRRGKYHDEEPCICKHDCDIVW